MTSSSETGADENRIRNTANAAAQRIFLERVTGLPGSLKDTIDLVLSIC